MLVYVKIHSTVTLGYMISGELSHRVKVFRNKKRIKSKPNLSVSKSNLTITNATMADAGIYGILVQNKYGKSRIEISLIIYIGHYHLPTTRLPTLVMSRSSSQRTHNTDITTHTRSKYSFGIASTVTSSLPKVKPISNSTKSSRDQKSTTKVSRSTMTTLSIAEANTSGTGIDQFKILDEFNFIEFAAL